MNYKRVAKNAGFRIDIKRGDDMRHFPLEKARIRVFIIPLYFGIAAILCWGWVLERNAPLAVPLVLSFIIGLCLTGSFNVMSTMLYVYSESMFLLVEPSFESRDIFGGISSRDIFQSSLLPQTSNTDSEIVIQSRLISIEPRDGYSSEQFSTVFDGRCWYCCYHSND